MDLNNLIDADKRVTLTFFLIGAFVGILGGLLCDFSLVSFYRWLDFYDAETKINSNTFPISLDFWIFLICTSILIGLFYHFHCILIKSHKETHQQNNPLSIDSGETPTGNTTESVQVSSVEMTDQNSYALIFNRFKENSALFTILATFVTTVTLIQVFAVFILGENWLEKILISPFGFPLLILILICLFSVIWFIAYLIILVWIDFYYNVIRCQNIRHTVRNEAIIFMLLGSLGISSVFIYLIFIWFAKLELLTSFLGVLLLILITAVPLLLLCINIYLQLHRQSQTCFLKALTLVVIIFLILTVIITTISIIPGLLLMNDQMSKYQSGKMIDVKISGENVPLLDKTLPALILINKTTDAGITKEFTFLDEEYTECDFSTNYGYFLLVTSNNSSIKKDYFELTIPGCGSSNDRIYWTYDINDYGKNKTPVYIGLTVKNSIKTTNNSLGNSRIMIRWNKTDEAIVYNNLTNMDIPFS